ncbi:glycoside hydrolase family 2 TIM barrel-domain containing protein [Lachnotalea glycerini]|uniref:Glycoside hydrolase family 2 protein n=1 Tax=Lachnotalea glycerini TaxID=1763509 RepID=A0A371JFX8_9FIRM|nr:glycoside hydrolase family 2 TIM barrel-domain containing protein [Lachnotalea glycerini]RDY31654.1 glycoside hydrolase family 2 protein [Lachnotalea glycerini]
MLEKKFNQSWKFWIDKDAFALVWNIPENAREIQLPHDAMLENTAHVESNNKGNTGYRDGDIYNYVKLINIPKDYKHQTAILKFEGVYMNASVYINGELAGKCPYGYSTFYVPMNDYLKYGEENEIRIIVRNGAMTNSRWYSGGGIYRDVYLLVSGLTYIVKDGVQVVTEEATKADATLYISTELKNRCHTVKELLLETTIKDLYGNVIAVDTIPIVLFEQEEIKMSQRIAIENPLLWSEHTPDLYICSSKLMKDGNVIDESESKFGIRTLQLDTKKGFRVNGVVVKLRGACIHHDSGLLGAATYDDAQYRQVMLLKKAGFNAIRMSHHPMSQSMLRACDELGVYVMDETFDMWNRCKSDYDYGLFFQEWWEKDVTAMVRKNFNHPSVILYSVGNEIPEIGLNHGAKICHQINEKIKSLDHTRYTLASINGVFASGDKIDRIVADVVAELSKEGKIDGNVNDFMTLMEGHMDEIVVHPVISERLEKACASTDIAGYNYMSARYKVDGEKYPNRVIVGSETYPPDIARNWELVEKYAHVIGDFTWTGWDYIGEAGVGIPAYNWGEGGFGAKFPCQLAYCGDFDITGFRRPVSYFREIVFGFRKNPYITVQNPYKYGEHLIKTPWILSDSVSSWTWSGCQGNPIVVEVYAPGEEVELVCNGKTLGKKPAGGKVGFITYFDTIYEAGTLTAISYEAGIEIGRMNLTTAGKKRNLVMTPEKINSELIYLPIELQDEHGTIITGEDISLEIAVEGAAEVAGFGSGNPKPCNNYNEKVTHTFGGRALLILKKNKNKGEIKVELSSDSGLKSQVCMEV